MTKLEKRKAVLLERIGAVEDERTLQALERTLEGATHHTPSPEQLKALDASMERYLHGEAKTYTPEQARTRALKAVRG
ncbi:MAG: hypothetical protein KBH07_11655 [Flavobacteriales bacterium]|nr:hypothetical protein [Flavobacteriales bacterium]MBP9081054.1 hypothetical protein [Flavobacteriales bacterium]